MLFSCSSSESKNENLYEGELFFKLITIGKDVFTVKEENGESLAEKFSSLSNETMLNEQEKDLKDHFDIMKNRGLIGRPYFHVKLSKTNPEFHRVYIGDKEYEKVSGFKLSDLQRKNQKVIVEFYGLPIHDLAINSSRIKSIKVVTGVTAWKK